jgi:predicted PurR-regulated permease PerM
VADSDLQLRIPFTTLLKIAFAVLLAVMVIKLWPVILMIVIAVLIAVMLDPIVLWLEAHRVRRPFGIAAVASVVFGLLIVVLFVLVPVVSREIANLMQELPQVIDRLSRAFPRAAPILQSLRSESQETHDWFARGLIAGKLALEGVSAVVFVLVVAIYLVIEGRRAFAWLISFAPHQLRGRIDRTADEVRVVMLSYVRGSVITATICALYVLGVLTALHVPLAILLAVLAFLFDFIPVVGTIIMTVPATLLAFLVSPGRALLVAGAYLLYHIIEAYILIPRIWGQQMRVSTLTVLLAIAIGGILQGPIGAVLALPIAAAYPIVERIWLRERLPADTVARHEQLEQTSK